MARTTDSRVLGPELALLAVLLALTGACWFLLDGNFLSAPRAAFVVGLADAVAILLLSGGVLMARPERFVLWHLYAALTAATFGAYGLSDAASLDDETWIRSVLAAFAIVKVGLGAAWIGSAWAIRFTNNWSLRQTIQILGDRVVRPGQRVAWFVVGVRWALQVFAFGQGVVISGTSGHIGELGYGAAVLVMLGPVFQTASVVAAALMYSRATPAGRRIWLAVLALEGAAAMILTGRRVMLATLAIGFLVWFMANPTRKFSLKTGLVGAVALAITIGVAWPFFYYMRTFANTAEVQLLDTANEERLGRFIEEGLPGAVRNFALADSYSTDSEYAQNVEVRSAATEYLGQIIEGVDDGVPLMMGDVTLNGIVMNIPRLFWPEKQVTDTEALINGHFGLPPVDSASTFMTHSYAELGLPGVILYLGFTGAILGLAVVYASKARFLLTSIFVLSLAMLVATQIEMDLDLVFGTLRWWLIALGLDVFIARLVTGRTPDRLTGARY